MRTAVQTVQGISKQALLRLPYYLNYLKLVQKEGTTVVSAPKIAAALALNEVQVRKDIALVSSCAGKPKTGFQVDLLIHDLESFLGYDNVDEAVLIGAGQLGRSLLGYKGFADYGLHIVAAFDRDAALCDLRFDGEQRIFPLEKLEDLCRRLCVHIGIICVPSENAQEVCDRLVACGIRAIWNFAPTHLTVPDGVLLQNENMASSLAVLSAHLKQSMDSSEI
ncbi:MAG: redox-sensing transcriptional repressor Rex [Candidatus Fimenecus sp.]